MKKAFLSLALLACGLVTYGQAIRYQDDTVYHKVGYLYYHITSDSTVELSPMQCSDGHCDSYPEPTHVPATVTIFGCEYTVNRIGYQAFRNSGELLFTITLPPTIEEIGVEAFKNGKAPITLPESVRLIEKGAFANRRSSGHMEVFHIPAGVKYIAEDAFSGTQIKRFTVDPANPHYVAVDSVALCNSDTTLLLAYAALNEASQYTVPATVRRIALGAFAQNIHLRTLVLPDGLREIGAELTRGSRLQNLRIPASVCRIESSLHDTASSAFNLTVDPASRHYRMEGNRLMSYDGDTLLQVLGAQGEYSVPTGVRVLGNGLFYTNKNLTKVILPDGLTAIGDWAFAYSTADVRLPSSLQRIGEAAFIENTGIKKVSLPNLTYMGKDAFYLSSLEEVDSLLSLRDIPSDAFSTSNLRLLNWGDQVETLGAYALSYTRFPVSPRVMPASLRCLGLRAYYPRSRTISITFIGRVDTIGEEALRCRILHLRDTHMPYIYPSALNETDTVYTPCGYAEVFERGIPHPDHVVFADWCHPEGIADSEAQPAAVLYPNPARGSFTVSGLPEGETLLTVTDLAGRTLLRQTIPGPSATIDVATLPAGSYLVTLAYPQGSSSQKLVLQ